MPVITMKKVFCCRPGQAARQVRHGSTSPENFHSKYGNGLMVGGGVFCTAVWAYVSSAVLLGRNTLIYKYDLNRQLAHNV